MRKKGTVAVIATLGVVVLALATIVVALYIELTKPEPVEPEEPKALVSVSNCTAYLDGRYLTSYKAVSYGETLDGGDAYYNGEEPIYPDVFCEPAGTLKIPTEELDTIAPFKSVEPQSDGGSSVGVPVEADPILTVTASVGVNGSESITTPPIVTVESETGVGVAENAPEASPAVSPDATDTTPATSEDTACVGENCPQPGDVGEVGEAHTVTPGEVGDATSIVRNGDGSFTCTINTVWVGTVPEFIGCDVLFTAYKQGA